MNTKIDDGSSIAELMKCFEQENVQNSKFPKLSARVAKFKNEETEDKSMCSLVENYAKEYAQEHVEEIAIALARFGDTDEKISLVTKLPLERIAELREQEMNVQ